MKDMMNALESTLNASVKDIISMTEDTVEMTGCSVNECFPYFGRKSFEHGGRKYLLDVEVKIKAG